MEVAVSELRSAAARLDVTAQRLKDGLSSVDDETAQLLGSGWKGGAASAYAPAWEKWHSGAEQVVAGLQRMSELLTIAGKEYAKTDESTAGALDSTVQGAGGSGGGGGPSGGQSASDGSVARGSGTSQSADGGAQQTMSPVSQLQQTATGLVQQAGQAATGIAQQAAQLAVGLTELVEEAAAHSGEEEAPAPIEPTPAERDVEARPVQRPGE